MATAVKAAVLLIGPTDLINPKSAISNTVPVIKNTEHLFFDLAAFTEPLKKNIHEGALQPEIKNKLNEWFEAGLQPWDISRDAPYFGFPVPDHPDKYFYVWLDANIGYMSIFKQLCDQKNIEFTPFWQRGSSNELYHFIGKDINVFSCAFLAGNVNGRRFKNS